MMGVEHVIPAPFIVVPPPSLHTNNNVTKEQVASYLHAEDTWPLSSPQASTISGSLYQSNQHGSFGSKSTIVSFAKPRGGGRSPNPEPEVARQNQSRRSLTKTRAGGRSPNQKASNRVAKPKLRATAEVVRQPKRQH